MIPIQVINGHVLIPREHLGDATEFEVEVEGGYVVVRPKPQNLNGADPQSLSAEEKQQEKEARLQEMREKYPEIDWDEDIEEVTARLKKKHPWIGTWEGLPPDASERVEEILYGKKPSVEQSYDELFARTEAMGQLTLHEDDE